MPRVLFFSGVSESRACRSSSAACKKSNLASCMSPERTDSCALDVPDARGKHGLLMDAEQRLAFIACEGNDGLVVLDMRTMRVASSFEVGKGPGCPRADPFSS